MFPSSNFNHEMRHFRRQMNRLFNEFDRNLSAFPLENDPFLLNDQMLEEPRPNVNLIAAGQQEAKGTTTNENQMALDKQQQQQQQQQKGDLSVPSGQQANALRPWNWGINQSFLPDLNAVSVPRVDVVENADNFLVNCDLPGVSKADVKVQVTPEGLLSIQGEHSERHEQKDENTKHHRIERSYGKFKRSLQLPSNVDANDVKAKHENGVLQITLPKKPKAETPTPKNIPIH